MLAVQERVLKDVFINIELDQLSKHPAVLLMNSNGVKEAVTRSIGSGFLFL